MTQRQDPHTSTPPALLNPTPTTLHIGDLVVATLRHSDIVEQRLAVVRQLERLSGPNDLIGVRTDAVAVSQPFVVQIENVSNTIRAPFLLWSYGADVRPYGPASDEELEARQAWEGQS